MSGKQNEGFGFERLEVWRKAVEFAGTVYEITSTCLRKSAFRVGEALSGLPEIGRPQRVAPTI